MVDWRQLDAQSKQRERQLTGNNANKGLFTAFVDSCSGEQQTAKLVYAGGERSIPIPMPFDSGTSWIRSIPQQGTTAICGYRSDTEDTVFLSYENSSPASKIAAYSGQANLYRPLQPGEHEICSAGYAQSYYSARPALDQKAGAARSWIDGDRLESGAKAPLHTRQLWEHKSNVLGDEERFGVVRRPLNFLLNNPLSALLALSTTSFIFSDYPFPDFTLPTGGIAGIGVAGKVASVAQDATGALALTGQFKKRFFAKEHLKIINNPMFPTPPNAKLIDFREGQVFDDDGLQTFSSHGSYLRAKYQYFTTAADATVITIDEIGNIDWTLSLVAKGGWSVTIPTGGISFTAFQDISYTTATGLSTSSLLSTSMTAGQNISFESLAGNISSTVVLGDYSVLCAVGSFGVTCANNASITTALNASITAAGKFDVLAGAPATITAPLVNLGPLASTPAIKGNEMVVWLSKFMNALLTASLNFTTGNLGAPTPLNEALVAQITELLAEAPTLVSTTVIISP